MASSSDSPSTSIYIPAITVAGHDGALQDQTGELFIKPTVVQELEFYQQLAEQHPDLQEITPLFMGTLTQEQLGANVVMEKLAKEIDETQDIGHLEMFKENSSNNGGNDKVILVLENLIFGYKEPCIIDIKLGSQLWDDNAPPEKRHRLDLVSQTTTSGSLGFRIAGMNVYDGVAKQRTIYDKQFGRNLNKNTIAHGLKQFFADGNDQMDSDIKKELCQGITAELKYIKKVLTAKEVEMRSVSILLIYEGDIDAFYQKLEAHNAQVEKYEQNEEYKDDDDNDEEEQEIIPLFRVKLIDFAHSKFVPNNRDSGTLKGLSSLIDIFRKLEIDFGR